MSTTAQRPASAKSDKSGAKPEPLRTNPYHPWTARCWHGILLGPWLKLLARHTFRIHPLRWGLTCTVTGAAAFNSTMRLVQEAIYGRKLARTELAEPPIFIIGHWRSGTTLLHELLVTDPRHTYPTFYQCFAPNHFLITAWLITKLKFMLPKQRPMDNMVTGWDRPQEDEFALCNMGVPSPYLTMAFPNDPPHDPAYLDLEGLSPDELERWKRALAWFLRRVSYRQPRRIVLKSPPHTCRVAALVEMFPDARFVHIVRDPCVVFASTVRLWKSLYKVQGLQIARNERLEEYVFDSFERMYRGFERQRGLIGPKRLFEVRYEDLVREPIDQMRALYNKLELPDFEAALPGLRRYLQDVRDYQVNKHELDPALCAEVDRRWGPYVRKYGYSAAAGNSTE